MTIEPRILELDTIPVLGILRSVNHAATDFQALWDRDFMVYHDQIRKQSIDGAYYGVSFRVEIDNADVVEYLAGMAVREPSIIPEGLVARYVPAGLYALFEFDFKDMNNTIGYALESWLPASPYERNHSVSITDFLIFGRGQVAFHLPVREAHTAQPDRN